MDCAAYSFLLSRFLFILFHSLTLFFRLFGNFAADIRKEMIELNSNVTFDSLFFFFYFTLIIYLCIT